MAVRCFRGEGVAEPWLRSDGGLEIDRGGGLKRVNLVNFF